MTEKEYQRAIVTISKEKLSTLPAASFPGTICLVDKPELIDQAIEELNKAEILGFDTETRPCFRKGQNYNVSLIQVATSHCCYLFRTNLIGFPEKLMALFQNKEKIKIGLSLHDDFHQIKKVTEFEPEGFIDLQSYVKDYKIADNSLSRLYGILFGERISKGQRLTNWEAAELTESQQQYAALDAFACIKIYQYLKEGNFNPKDSIYLTLQEEETEVKDNPKVEEN